MLSFEYYVYLYHTNNISYQEMCPFSTTPG